VQGGDRANRSFCQVISTHPCECFYVPHSRLVGAECLKLSLPSYSPELNPEERLNGDLKQAIGAKVPVRTKAKLKSAAIEHMTKLEQDTDRVMAYFQDPFVKYAAAS
jgi:hypothetical protein